MEYRILGPLEVADEGGSVPLGRLKERVVLAVMLLHANEFVSRDRLIDELWGESPPPTARKAVNVYVSQLRKALARDGQDVIATVAGGYRLEVEPEALDTARMQRLLGHARERAAAGEPERAAALFREALALWRGPTLPDLPFESLARVEVEQLDEVRLGALMDRIDCDLALGRHEQVLGELKLLVREQPLRERFRAQLMLALYRADRQAEALDAYAEARRALVDDLGIEPSEALQRLQQAILRHDPSLETPEGTAAANGLPSSTTEPLTVAEAEVGEAEAARSPARFRPRRKHVALAAVAVLGACAAAAAAILSTSAGASVHVVRDSLVRIDPRNGKVVSDTPLGTDPAGFFAVTPRAVWTVDYPDAEGNAGTGVSRYDVRTHMVQSLRSVPPQPFGIAADGQGDVWVSSSASDIARLAFGTKGTSDIPVPPPGAGALAFGSGYLWAIAGPITTPGLDDRVWLVDRATDRIVRSLALGHETTSIAFGYGAAWIGGFANESDLGNRPLGWTASSWLTVVRAAARRPRSYRLETGDTGGPGAVAVGSGKVWVLLCGACSIGVRRNELVEFDPGKRRVVDRIPLTSLEPSSLAVGGGFVWLANAVDASVTQLDPKTGHIVRTISVGQPRTAPECGIAATRDAVWVTIGSSSGCVNSG